MTLGENTYFGDEHLFVKDSVQPCDVITIVGTRIYTLNRTSFITVLSSFPEYQENVIKWGDERRRNLPINTRISMYKLHDESDNEDSSTEDDSSIDENNDTETEKVGLKVDDQVEGEIEQKNNPDGLYLDTSGDQTTNTIPNQITKLENIVTQLSRLILVQSGNECNLDVSNDIQSSIDRNSKKVLSMLQPSTMIMQQGHPTPPKMLSSSNRTSSIGIRGKNIKNDAPVYKSMDSNPRFGGGGGYSIAENDDTDEYTIS